MKSVLSPLGPDSALLILELPIPPRLSKAASPPAASSVPDACRAIVAGARRVPAIMGKLPFLGIPEETKKPAFLKAVIWSGGKRLADTVVERGC